MHPMQTPLLLEESRYLFDWKKDARAYAALGLYARITDMIEPKADDVIVDVGLGTGHQLFSLMATRPEATLIGTDRTSMNVYQTYQMLVADGVGDAFMIVTNGNAVESQPGQLHWEHNRAWLQEHVTNIRELLRTKVLLLQDNILYPQALPAILDRPITAAIHSLPGGSAMRAYEWPYTREDMEHIPEVDRITDITQRTRYAFAHYMSQHMVPQGRLVLAERVLVDPEHDPMRSTTENMRYAMGDQQVYWEPHSSRFVPLNLQNTSVPLRTAKGESIHADRPLPAVPNDARTGIVITRFNRNDKPWAGQPLATPTAPTA